MNDPSSYTPQPYDKDPDLRAQALHFSLMYHSTSDAVSRDSDVVHTARKFYSFLSGE